MKHLHDYIFVLENAIPFALCDAVIDEYKNSNEWTNATTAGNKPDYRTCFAIGISFNNIIDKNKNVRAALDKYLHVTAIEVINKYKEKFPNCVIAEDTGYDLLRYETGQFYKEHTDSFKDRPRAVSCSFALNDSYEGGEFAFFNRELVYKLKKGSAIMFPSNFMYPHEVMPVTSGTRYSIVTWVI